MREFYNKSKDKFWFSAVLNLIILILILAIYRPQYETNDDMAIACLVNGAKGVYDAHLIQSSYFLGVILSILYRIYQPIPWYSIVQYLVLYFSFTLTTWALLHRIRRPEGIWFILIAIVWISYEGYAKVQFTKTSGIAAAAGLFVMLYTLSEDRVPKRYLLAGAVVAIFGFFYRYKQFLAVGALMTSMGLWLLLDLTRIGKGNRLKRFLRYICPFALLLLVCRGLYLGDRAMYQSEEWQAYLAYDVPRTSLYDYGFPNYEGNEDYFEEIGITKAAYKLLDAWTHYDTQYFTTETLQKIADLKGEKTFSKEVVEDFFDKYPAKFSENMGFFVFLVLIVVWLFQGRHDKWSILTIFYELAAILLVYLFLFYLGRYNYNRVDTGIWFAGVLTALWLLHPDREYFSHRTGALVLSMLLVLVQFSWKNNWRINTEDRVETLKSNRAALETIAADKDHMYICQVNSFSVARSYGVFDSVPYNIFENIATVCGWTVGTPIDIAILENYGITNPLQECIDSDTIYIVDTTHIKRVRNYLRDYYDETVKEEEVNSIGGKNIYRFTSNPS